MKAQERRIRAAAVLVLLGLVVEALTLQWAHPTASVVFGGVSVLSLLLGTALYLSSLLRGAP